MPQNVDIEYIRRVSTILLDFFDPSFQEIRSSLLSLKPPQLIPYFKVRWLLLKSG